MDESIVFCTARLDPRLDSRQLVLDSRGNREVQIESRIETRNSIARNRGHFAPVINCQRNLIFKMTDKNDRSQGKRIPCDFLNNLSSVDLFYKEKSWNKTPCKKMLGLYAAERLIVTKQYADVPFVTFS